MQEFQLNHIFDLNKEAFKEEGVKAAAWKKMSFDDKIATYEDVAEKYELTEKAPKKGKSEEKKNDPTLTQLFNKHFVAKNYTEAICALSDEANIQLPKMTSNTSSAVMSLNSPNRSHCQLPQRQLTNMVLWRLYICTASGRK